MNDRLRAIKTLVGELVSEMPEYEEAASSIPDEISEQRRLLRSLMNVREPRAASERFLALQDELLSQEREEKGVVNAGDIPYAEKGIKLWRGDITRLSCDAVVNAANSALLGCFVPCHGCVDNAIHSAAGVQLRLECGEIIKKQGRPEPTGKAKITGAYNLPCRYVIHTVGPIVSGELTKEDRGLLESCYKSCLEAALENGLFDVAFCCISTGEFHFPNEKAAEIAVSTAREFVKKHNIDVIFSVFKEQDEDIYKRLLGI